MKSNSLPSASCCESYAILDEVKLASIRLMLRKLCNP
jgi:hypothetical protein